MAIEWKAGRFVKDFRMKHPTTDPNTAANIAIESAFPKYRVLQVIHVRNSTPTNPKYMGDEHWTVTLLLEEV